MEKGKDNRALELAIKNVTDIKTLFDSAKKGKENDKFLSALEGQIARSCTSVVLNISESTDHISQPMRLNKLNIACGENQETIANIRTTIALGYIFKQDCQELLDNLDQVKKILNKSLITIKNKLKTT